MTSTTAVAEALTCAFIAITEVLPPYHRRIVDNILTGALREEGLIRGDTRKVLERLVDNPPPRRVRALPRATRARARPR